MTAPTEPLKLTSEEIVAEQERLELWVCLACRQTWLDDTSLIPSGGGYGHSLGHDLCGEVVEVNAARDDAAELRETAEWSGLLSDALGRCADYLEAVLQTSIDGLEPEAADAFRDAVRTAGNLLARFDGGKPAPKDDAAELRAALREWAEATRAAEWFELDQTNAYGDDHIDAEDRVEAARRALLALAATEGRREP